jgi:hypothetical protein
MYNCRNTLGSASQRRLDELESNTCGENQKCIRNFVGNPKGKKSFGKFAGRFGVD